MSPTMKLRWRRATHGDDCVPFGVEWRSGFSDEWGMLTGYVLQQLWEGKDFESTSDTPCYKSEWRDIPIETEK